MPVPVKKVPRQEPTAPERAVPGGGWPRTSGRGAEEGAEGTCRPREESQLTELLECLSEKTALKTQRTRHVKKLGNRELGKLKMCVEKNLNATSSMYTVDPILPNLDP